MYYFFGEKVFPHSW